MIFSDARHIAQNYLSAMGEVFPGFGFGAGDEEEFFDSYYFDLVFLSKDGSVIKEPPVAGGAKGVSVNKKTGEVKLLSFGEYFSLVHKKNELNEAFELINGLKNNRKNLSVIKSRYNLTSKQLLDFLKAIDAKKLSKEKIFEQIDQLLGEI